MTESRWLPIAALAIALQSLVASEQPRGDTKQ